MTDDDFDEYEGPDEDPSPRPAQPTPPPRDRTAERRLFDYGRVSEDEIVEFMAQLWPDKPVRKA